MNPPPNLRERPPQTTMSETLPTIAPSPMRLPGRRLGHYLLIVLLFGAAVAPTLPWMEFSGGMENTTVATAMETARDGHWLLPTLDAVPRLVKPPLVHWITAVGILSSNSTAWGARWPTLLCAILFLMSVYELASLLGGRQIALAAALICGSNLLFLEHAGYASYDMPLATFVGWTNVFIAMAIFQRRWFFGCCAAGITLGLAIMAKGPVALAQTVAPMAVVQAIAAIVRRGQTPAPALREGLRRQALAVGLGTALMLAIALPWYLYVLRRIPGVWDVWMGALTMRAEAKFESHAPWYHYLQFLYLMAPWSMWLFIGLLALIVDNPYKHNKRILLALAWLVAPVVFMSFVSVKRTRYLVPMLSPAAILAAWGLLVHLPGWLARKPLDRLLAGIHWGFLLLMGLGLPIAGAIGLKELRTVDGAAWYPPALAAGAAALIAAMVITGIFLYRRWAGGLVLTTTIVMLILRALFMYGYTESPNGRSAGRPLAQRILDRYPDPAVYCFHPAHRTPPLEMPIYLNRAVPPLESPADLKASSRIQLILVPGGRDFAPPVFPGYRVVDQQQFDDAWWYVYELVG